MFAYLVLGPLETKVPDAARKVLLALFPFCVPVNEDTVSELARRRHIRWGVCSGATLLFAPFAWVLVFWSTDTAHNAVEFPSMVARYFFLTNGVNPLLPLCLLLLGIHAWIWKNVRGTFLQSFVYHPCPSPLLVGSEDGQEIKYLRKGIEKTIQHFSKTTGVLLATGLIVLMWAYQLYVRDFEVHSGFTAWSNGLWTFLVGLLVLLILASLQRFAMLWWQLKKLLRRLEYHPLRQGFTRLPDRLSWTSIWSIDGLRPTMVSMQMTGDYLSAMLAKFGGPDGPGNTVLQNALCDIESVMTVFFKGQPISSGDTKMVGVQIEKICTHYINELESSWNSQRIDGWNPERTAAKVEDPEELPSKSKQLEILKDEFIALQYCAYIRYAFLHLRNFLGFVVTGLTLLFLSFNVYPFEPNGTLSNCATWLFSLSAMVIITVFYQMDKDRLLSRLSTSSEGKLDAGFFPRLLQFGALPTVTFLAIHFPPIGQALVKITQIIPGLGNQ